jgi:hypothetical protein
LSYADSGGTTVHIPVQLKARGHFRRAARNCDFPPLWLDYKSNSAKKTFFAGLKRVKITTNCRPGNGEYEQYILQEYALYRAYTALTDNGLHTRLAWITYRDSTGRVAPITTWAFFIEDHADLAARTDRRVFSANGVLFDDLEQDPLRLVSVFEYFVGNTDWSVSAQHNILLLRDSSVKIMPVAYDFDWSGAVNARYAKPDARLPVRAVTERLYRGVCMTAEQLQPTLDLFKARRSAIDGVLAQIPALAPDRAKKMQLFYDDFWKRLADPRGLQREFANDCKKEGN